MYGGLFLGSSPVCVIL